MTGLRVRSLSRSALLILRLPARAHAACDVPPDPLAGRLLLEIRRVLEGEVRSVADARLHDCEGRTAALRMSDHDIERPAFPCNPVEGEGQVRFQGFVGGVE
ncbi:MAG: hypothetical protein U1B94_07755 [candidate division NC10 bacterium]|nr:hypothetical protein [candidate division NC10 bacterium]